MRLANAFAHSGKSIFLTDYLLKHLNKREVDAILGHELSHLGMKHFRKRVYLWVAAGFAVGFVLFLLDLWHVRGIPGGPVIFGSLLLALFVVSRRNEFSADAGALKLTAIPRGAAMGYGGQAGATK
jgi:STE24 endopeptidase